jgi:hypothetical protein
MNLAAITDELARDLGSVEGLQGRAFGYPPNALVPPAAVVGWPDEINYDLAMGRGAWSVKFPLLIVVGKSDVRSARDAISGYLDSSGPSSVRTALDRGSAHSAYDSVLVLPSHVGPVTIAGIEYLAALWDVEVVGGGAR